MIAEGAILGRRCDVRAHARLHEGVAIGDEVAIGSESVVYPDNAPSQLALGFAG